MIWTKNCNNDQTSLPSSQQKENNRKINTWTTLSLYLKKTFSPIQLNFWLVSTNAVILILSILFLQLDPGSLLCLFLLLIYINDVHKSIRYSKTYHFTDDTIIIKSSLLLKILTKQVNTDLPNLSNWLKPDKLSLNVNKTFKNIKNIKNWK